VYGRFGITGVRPVGSRVYEVTFAQDPGLAKLAAASAQDSRIEAVQPNMVYKAN
jgi:hypothetical protein